MNTVGARSLTFRSAVSMSWPPSTNPADSICTHATMGNAQARRSRRMIPHGRGYDVPRVLFIMEAWSDSCAMHNDRQGESKGKKESRSRHTARALTPQRRNEN